MTAWIFESLEDEVRVISAPTWYYAREFARTIMGDDVIHTATITGPDADDEAQYQLRWHGNACRNNDNLYLQIRKRCPSGKWSSWRKL